MATEKAPKATAAKAAKPKAAAKDTVKASPKEAAPAKSGSKEATLEMNGKFYKLADLSAEAKGNLQSIQFADQEVRRLSMMLSMAKTARAAYRTALQANLPPEAE
jgi:hypothetical protein